MERSFYKIDYTPTITMNDGCGRELTVIHYSKEVLHHLTFSHRPNANKYVSPVNHLHRKKRPYILQYSDWQPPARAFTVTLTGRGGGGVAGV